MNVKKKVEKVRKKLILNTCFLIFLLKTAKGLKSLKTLHLWWYSVENACNFADVKRNVQHFYSSDS